MTARWDGIEREIAEDVVMDFARADKAALDRHVYLLSRATSLAECERALEHDSILKELNAEAGRRWKRLPANLRKTVLNPDRKEFSMRNLKGWAYVLAVLSIMALGAFGVMASMVAYMESLQ